MLPMSPVLPHIIPASMQCSQYAAPIFHSIVQRQMPKPVPPGKNCAEYDPNTCINRQVTPSNAVCDTRCKCASDHGDNSKTRQPHILTSATLRLLRELLNPPLKARQFLTSSLDVRPLGTQYMRGTTLAAHFVPIVIIDLKLRAVRRIQVK